MELSIPILNVIQLSLAWGLEVQNDASKDENFRSNKFEKVKEKLI